MHQFCVFQYECVNQGVDCIQTPIYIQICNNHANISNYPQIPTVIPQNLPKNQPKNVPLGHMCAFLPIKNF